jgi:hypothetical protein
MKRQIGCLALAVVFAMNAVAAEPAKSKDQKAERRAVRARIVANQIREINAVNRAEFVGGLAGTLTGLWVRHLLDNRAQKASAAQYYQQQNASQESPLVWQPDRPAFGEFGGNKPGSLDAPAIAVAPPTAVAIPEQLAPLEADVRTTSAGVRIIGLE